MDGIELEKSDPTSVREGVSIPEVNVALSTAGTGGYLLNLVDHGLFLAGVRSGIVSSPSL